MEHLVIYDDSPKRTLEKKIARACARFRQKFGQVPTECLALPSAIGDLKKVGVVEVKAKHNALIHHFWIGRNDESVQTTAAS